MFSDKVHCCFIINCFIVAHAMLIETVFDEVLCLEKVMTLDTNFTANASNRTLIHW